MPTGWAERSRGDVNFLRDAYPVMKGCVEFFLDFLVEHPKYGWLVTNPSTSPENFPAWPGNDPFYDEVCSWMTPGTTICAGSTIDMQILSDLFGYVAEAAKILGVDREFGKVLLEKRSRLAPMRIGKNGDLQEWLEDWGQKDKSHRHISQLYGLYPGNQVSLKRTPELAQGCRAVLEQRGLEGNGWSSAWKTACGAIGWRVRSYTDWQAEELRIRTKGDCQKKGQPPAAEAALEESRKTIRSLCRDYFGRITASMT